MAGRGPVPKPAEQRRRRNADPVGRIELVDDGELRGPSIEDATYRGGWPAPVLAWWDVWRRSPQAAAFLATDWNVLSRLALLVERQVLQPSGAIAAEIRLVEASLGATVADRQRLRMVVEKRDPAPVVAISSASRESLRARLEQ